MAWGISLKSALQALPMVAAAAATAAAEPLLLFLQFCSDGAIHPLICILSWGFFEVHDRLLLWPQQQPQQPRLQFFSKLSTFRFCCDSLHLSQDMFHCSVCVSVLEPHLFVQYNSDFDLHHEYMLRYLLDASQDPNVAVYYSRYVAELTHADVEKQAAENARGVYVEEHAVAENVLAVTHQSRLGLALNYHVFQYVLQSSDKHAEWHALPLRTQLPSLTTLMRPRTRIPHSSCSFFEITSFCGLLTKRIARGMNYSQNLISFCLAHLRT